jgi:hypothetical protein
VPENEGAASCGHSIHFAGIAMQILPAVNAIDPDLSEAPENRQEGHPKCRTSAAIGSKR